MKDLHSFIGRIEEFDSYKSSEMIPYFIYFLHLNDNEYVTSKDIKICFDELSINPYSNISQYLSSKSSGSGKIFIKNSHGYKLLRPTKLSISSEMGVIKVKESSTLVNISMLDDTPYYLSAISNQMNLCYDEGLYDACLVLMRKLVETIIIECFERFGIDDEIKDKNGNYLYLSDLIPKLTNNSKWTLSRNITKNISKVKKYGDLSAHNRRFIGKQKDIDELKFELRQSIEELVLLVDYKNWHR